MKDLAEKLKLISDPNRLQILQALAAGPRCVSSLAQRVNSSPSAVSQHLRVLREAGLVLADKRGNWVHYQVNRERLQALSASFEQWCSRLVNQPAARGGDTCHHKAAPQLRRKKE